MFTSLGIERALGFIGYHLLESLPQGPLAAPPVGTHLSFGQLPKLGDLTAVTLAPWGPMFLSLRGFPGHQAKGLLSFTSSS